MEDRVWTSYERSLRLRQLSAQTIDNYRKTARKVRAFTGKAVHEADRFDLEELFDSWLTVLADSTRQHHWINLASFMNWAVEQEHIERNPLRGIPMPTIEDVPPRVLSEKELRTLIAACKGKLMRDKRDEAIIRLMSEPGGMRNTEVRLLRVTDIDWSHCVANVWISKSKPRPVPFGDKTARALEIYVKAREKHAQRASQWLWLTGRQSANGMNADTLRDIVHRRARMADLGEVYPHILRGTAADRVLASGGFMPGDVNKLFGWSERGGSKMQSVYGRGRATQRALDAARRSNLGGKL